MGYLWPREPSDAAGRAAKALPWRGALRSDAPYCAMTNQGVLIELTPELADDDKGTMLGILKVRQGDQSLALALVPSNEPYANMHSRAPGCMPFLLPKDYSPLPTSQRIYIQNQGLHD